MIPEGADAVIMQEQVTLNEDFGTITFSKLPKPANQNIRRIGVKRCKKGDVVLEQGAPLTPVSFAIISLSRHCRSKMLSSIKRSAYSQLAINLWKSANHYKADKSTTLTVSPQKIITPKNYTVKSLILGLLPDNEAEFEKHLLPAQSQADLKVMITSGGVCRR